jgi:hypothetical protein
VATILVSKSIGGSGARVTCLNPFEAATGVRSDVDMDIDVVGMRTWSTNADAASGESIPIHGSGSTCRACIGESVGSAGMCRGCMAVELEIVELGRELAVHKAELGLDRGARALTAGKGLPLLPNRCAVNRSN